MSESEWADSGKEGGGGGSWGSGESMQRDTEGNCSRPLELESKTSVCLKLGDLCVFHFSIPIFEWGWGLGGHSENLSTTNI